MASDGDHTPYAVNNRFVQEETEQYSQEFQILGDIFDDRINYIVGLYGIHEKGESAYQAEVLPGIEEVLGDILSQSARAC